MRLKWFALALVATIVMACSDEDNTNTPEQEPEPEKKTLVIEVPTEPELPTPDVWLIISDVDGTVLDTARLTNGKNHTFEAPDDFKEDAVALTIAWSLASYPENPGKREMYVRTYADIPFGKFQYPKKQSLPETSSNPGEDDPVSSMKITGAFARGWNMEEMLCFPEGSHAYQYTAFPASDAVRIDIQAKKSALLLAHPTKIPFNYWYQEFAGETHNISANNFLIAETEKMEVPSGGDIRYTIKGKNQSGQFRYFSSYQPVGATSVDIPVPTGLFQSYETSVSITSNAGVYGYVSTDSHVPERANIINGSFDILLQDNSITTTVNVAAEEADILILDATSDEGGYLRWWVYATPGNRTITPPLLPDYITMGDGETARSFTILAKRHGLAQYLGESSAHQGYYDYLTNYELVGKYPLPKELLTLEKFKK